MHVRSEARMKKSCFKIQNLQQKHDVGIVSEVCVGELRWGVDSSFNFRAYCCVAKQTVWIFMILIFPQSSSTRNYTVFFCRIFRWHELEVTFMLPKPNFSSCVCVCLRIMTSDYLLKHKRSNKQKELCFMWQRRDKAFIHTTLTFSSCLMSVRYLFTIKFYL